MTTIYSIGHSTHSIDEFVELLRRYDIDTLADIRSHPGSRRCPQFNSEFMSRYLRERGIGYVHIPKLGGRRPTQWNVDPTINSGWDDPSFKNYADYTLSNDYVVGLRHLCMIARERKVAYMCCEGNPWSCHRLLVSNSLFAQGWDVRHIFADNHVEKHKMGVWGAPVHVEDGIVTYPSDKPVQLMLMI